MCFFKQKTAYEREYGLGGSEMCIRDRYTWWSNRGQAWAKNVGWRIDYHLATPGLAALARRESIYLDQRFSDHAPLLIDYDVSL